MIFRWLKRRRRRKILEEPFPEEWREILGRHVAHWRRFSAEERRRFEELVAVFVAEKSWEGCGGLELTDEIRITVAGQACLLLLNLDHDYYRYVRSILIYPSTVVVHDERRGGGVVGESTMPILGQAMMRGPVLLVWDAVRAASVDPAKGHNVVYHEFAHKLDMLDGSVDGIPPLFTLEQFDEWGRVLAEQYNDLRERTRRGRKTLLAPYAATNPAEFFAVSTELFFDRPRRLRERRPELYRVLAGFYRQDPANRSAGER